MGGTITFDKVDPGMFTRLVGSVTAAPTWHDPADNPDQVLDIDGQLSGVITIDESAASILFNTMDQIVRALVTEWQLTEVWVSDRNLHEVLKTLGQLSDGRAMAAVVQLRPRHLNCVHYKFAHTP